MKKIFHKRYKKHLLEPELDIPEGHSLHGELLREVVYHKKIHSHLEITFSHIEKIESEMLKDEANFRDRLLESLRKEREEGGTSPASGRKRWGDLSGNLFPFSRFSPSLTLQISALGSVVFVVGIMGWSFSRGGGPGFSESGMAKHDSGAYTQTMKTVSAPSAPLQESHSSGSGAERLAAPGPMHGDTPSLPGSASAESAGVDSSVPPGGTLNGPDDRMTEKVLTLRFAGAHSRKEKIDITEKLIRFYRDRGRTEDLHRMEDRLRVLKESPAGSAGLRP